MAEISDDVFERYIDRLEELMARGVPIGKDLEKLVNDFRKGLIAGAKNLKDITDSMKKYDDQIKKGRVNARDLGYAIKKLEDSIDDLKDSGEKSIAREKLNELKRKKVADEQMQRVTQQAKSGWDTIKSQTGSSLKRVTSSYMDSAAGFELAGEMLNIGITAAGQGGKLAGSAMSALGTTMMMGPLPQMKIFGGLLALAGGALGIFTDAAKQMASVAADIVVKQSNELLKGFETASQAGVTLAGGMTEFNMAATDAQLTLTQMSNVVKENAETLAMSGLTVTGAVRKLGQVGKALEPFREQLLAMGVGFQEQMEITTKVIADARRAGLQLTDRQAAEAVKDYAKNLRLIADITGEDAKKKQDEARKMAEDFEFRRKLMDKARELGPEKGAEYIRQVVDSLALMPEVVQRGIKQEFVGGAITDIGVIMTNQVDTAKKFTHMMEQGTITAEKAATLRGEAADRFMNDAQTLGRTLGKISALGGNVADFYKDFTPLQIEYMKGGSDAIGQAIGRLDQMGKPTDEITQRFVQAQKDMKDLQMTTQALAMKGMPLLANATTLLTEAMTQALRKLEGIVGKTPTAAEYRKTLNKAQEDRLLAESKEFAKWQEEKGAKITGKSRMYDPEYGVDQYRKEREEESKRQIQGFYNEKKIREAQVEAATAGTPELAKIISKSGASAMVAKEAAPTFQALVDYLDKSGYQIKSLGGYADRDVRGKPGTKSVHASGYALDINPEQNPMGQRLVTDMPKNIGEVARGLGLGWGGDWKTVKDAMHFSAAKTEGGAGTATVAEGSKRIVTAEGKQAVNRAEDDRTAMLEALQELVDVNKDNRDYLERLFHNSV